MTVDRYAMNRRRLLQRALTLVGAGAVAGPLSINAQTPGPDTEFSGLLAAVAQTMIPATDTPGAVEVGVPGLLHSLLLDWASPSSREQITAALRRIDAAAVRQTGQPFSTLSASARLNLLTAHDAAAFATRQPAADLTAGAAAVISDPAYARLKQLIVVLYYYSEPAQTRELAYQHVPGKWEASIRITPATRPAGGAARF